jgi:chitodextrinase
LPLATCTQQSFLEGTHYSTVQVAQFAHGGGFTGNDWVISVAVAEAESGGWSHARLIDTDCSVDRGMWQINSYWHSEVSDACAFDPTCAASATHTIWANGGWSQWTTYTNGAYLSHMADAQAAVNQVSGGGTGGGGGGACTAPAWSASAVYVGGNTVSYNGHTWQAKWWTQGETPGAAQVWADLGACSGGGSGTGGGGGGTGGGGTGGGSGGSSGTRVANHAYTVGDSVTYNGHTYRCLQSHTSLPGWEPPNVPALWQFVS